MLPINRNLEPEFNSANPVGQPNVNQQGQPNINQQGQPNINQQGQPNINQHGQPNANPVGQPNINQHGQPNVNPAGQPNAQVPNAEPLHLILAEQPPHSPPVHIIDDDEDVNENVNLGINEQPIQNEFQTPVNQLLPTPLFAGPPQTPLLGLEGGGEHIVPSHQNVGQGGPNLASISMVFFERNYQCIQVIAPAHNHADTTAYTHVSPLNELVFSGVMVMVIISGFIFYFCAKLTENFQMNSGPATYEWDPYSFIPSDC